MTKAAEYREMSDEQLAQTLKETTESLFRLRLQAQTERLDANSELRKHRRLIARIKTVQHERAGRAGGRPSEDRQGTQAMPKRVAVGVVTSDRMSKTRRVEIPRLVKHPKYGKYLRRRTICYVHDEQNVSKLGDTVEIAESRPRSRLKRWELVKVVSRGEVLGTSGRRGEGAEELEA